MHHKTSDSVEIQENEVPEKARKREMGKFIFLYFPKIGRIRTNSDEIPPQKNACFPQYEFLCGRIQTSFFGFSKNFRKLGKLQKNSGRI